MSSDWLKNFERERRKQRSQSKRRAKRNTPEYKKRK